MSAFTWLYERLTGTPWYTTPAWASRDGVRLAGAVYRDELACYTDAELYAHGEAILAGLRARRSAVARAVAGGKTKEPEQSVVAPSWPGPLLPPVPGGPAARRLASVAGPPCQARVRSRLPPQGRGGPRPVEVPPAAALPVRASALAYPTRS
jgi:hypothetical protein